MAKSEIIVGLDIGTTKICAIVGQEDEHGKLQILGMGKSDSEGVKRGVVTNIDLTIKSINRALGEAEAKSGVRVGKVNVGIAGHHIKSSIEYGSVMSTNTDGEISKEDVARLINDMYKIVTPMGTQILHVMPQDFKVDDHPGVKFPIGEAGKRLEANFHVITADISAVGNITKSVKRSGTAKNLEIQDLILEPLASSLSVLDDLDKEMGVALVDIGGGTTDVAVFHDGIIRHTAVIPFGGDIITQDIKEGCNVLKGEAEQLKVQFGKALADKAKKNEIITIPGLRRRQAKEISCHMLSQVIQSRMEDIIELVDDQLINSGYKDKLGAGIVLTGGGALLDSAKHLFEYMTGLGCEVGFPNPHLGKSKDESVKSPMYATAIGLVLAGFKQLDERGINDKLEKEVKEADDPVTARDKGKGMFASITKRLGTTINLKDLIVDKDLEDDSEY